jgi:hypothetical protein
LPQGIHKVASEVLRNIAVEYHKDWYDKECQIATEKKNKACTIMQQRSYTRSSVEELSGSKKKLKKST